MIELLDIMRERIVAQAASTARPSNPRFERAAYRLIGLNVLIFFFPLVVITMYIKFGVPDWLIGAEALIGCTAIGLQVCIARWSRPDVNCTEINALLDLGLSDDIVRTVAARVQRSWHLAWSSLLPLVGVIAGSLAIAEVNRTLYLIEATEYGIEYWQSALSARRFATAILVVSAVIATFIPLLLSIYVRRMAIR